MDKLFKSVLNDDVERFRVDIDVLILLIDKVDVDDRPLSVVWLRRKRCPVPLTRTAWVQFLPAPTHETCICCSAKSGLMKLACLMLMINYLNLYLLHILLNPVYLLLHYNLNELM